MKNSKQKTKLGSIVSLLVGHAWMLLSYSIQSPIPRDCRVCGFKGFIWIEKWTPIWQRSRQFSDSSLILEVGMSVSVERRRGTPAQKARHPVSWFLHASLYYRLSKRNLYDSHLYCYICLLPSAFKFLLYYLISVASSTTLLSAK